jgi:hypothetical protein
MGLAMPHEFLEEGGEGGDAGPAGEADVEPASAPGRLILRVEGGKEVDSLLSAYAVSTAQQQAAGAAPPAGVQLPSSCAGCGAGAGAGFQAALHTPVPAFIRDSVIVSARCGSCGAASADVRGTGGVSEQGARLRRVETACCTWAACLAGLLVCRAQGLRCSIRATHAFLLPHVLGCRLRVEHPADLERAVLQSASASIAVPELELALSTGSSSGMATTVGALINNVSARGKGGGAWWWGGMKHAPPAGACCRLHCLWRFSVLPSSSNPPPRACLAGLACSLLSSWGPTLLWPPVAPLRMALTASRQSGAGSWRTCVHLPRLSALGLLS